MPNKLHVFISYDLMLEHICAPKKKRHNVLKTTNVLKKGLKPFSVFMKFVVSTLNRKKKNLLHKLGYSFNKK
jgi:hypothetical protein